MHKAVSDKAKLKHDAWIAGHSSEEAFMYQVTEETTMATVEG